MNVAPAKSTTRSPLRKFLKISLRMLLVLVAVLAVWLARVTNRARLQAEVVKELQARNARFYFDYETDGNLTTAEWQRRITASPLGLEWLRKRLGDEYFRTVTRVSWYTDRRPPPRKLDPSFRGPRPEDDFVRKLGSLPGLASLAVMLSEVSDQGLANVAHMQALEAMLVAGCPNVTDAAFAHVQGLRKLKYVTFQECEIGDQTLAYLANVPSLEILMVRGGHITDAGLAQVGSMASLKVLSLENPAITDTGLAHLRGLSNLRHLVLRPGGPALTDQALESIRSLPELVSLTIANPQGTGSDFTNEAILKLVQSLPKLRSLTLKPANTTPEFIAELEQAHPGLQVTIPLRFTLSPPARPAE